MNIIGTELGAVVLHNNRLTRPSIKYIATNCEHYPLWKHFSNKTITSPPQLGLDDATNSTRVK